LHLCHNWRISKKSFFGVILVVCIAIISGSWTAKTEAAEIELVSVNSSGVIGNGRFWQR
jgi:hypothetical protein